MAKPVDWACYATAPTYSGSPLEAAEVTPELELDESDGVWACKCGSKDFDVRGWHVSGSVALVCRSCRAWFDTKPDPDDVDWDKY